MPGAEQPYGVGAGQGVLGLDANGQHAWTTLLLSMVTMVAWAVSWLALVSPSVPTQYPQTNTLLAAVADSGTQDEALTLRRRYAPGEPRCVHGLWTGGGGTRSSV
jgi:hypothetical protein